MQVKVKIRSSGGTEERTDCERTDVSGGFLCSHALGHLLSPRTAPSDPRTTVSCLHGLALLAAEPTIPCELVPSISGVQGVGSVHGWSDTMQRSSTPGLSLAVCILLAGELSCRQEQLHETTRSLASLCHLPAELTWQPNACKSYPQRASSPCL